MRQTRNAVATLLLALALVACAPSTRLGATWSDTTRPAQPYRDLLVFGIAANETVRTAYEDSFVAALEKRGVRARTGHSLVPPGGMANAKTVKKAVDLSGAQGVIVTHLLGADSQTVHAPPRSYVTPGLYGKLYPYYGRVYDYVSEPGYYATYRVLQLETNLYDTTRESLVWSARSESMDPTSERTTIGDVIDAVTAALAQAGYLPK